MEYLVGGGRDEGSRTWKRLQAVGAGRRPRPSRERFADDEAVTALQEARQLVEASALLGGLPGGGGLDELVDADDGAPLRG